MALPAPSPSATVVITGASSGIGEEFARQLASKGHNLTLVARRRELLEELADSVSGDYGVVVDVEPRDLGDEDDRRLLVKALQAREVIGLINNAGFGTSGRFWQLDLERETQQVRLNAGAVHHLTGAVLPGMVEQGSGAVLNVASIAAFQPLPDLATYCATKAFVLAFSEAVHAELNGTGVSCTALCPGPIHTAWEEVAGLGSSWMPEIAYTSVEDVAKDGIAGMEQGKRGVVPGKVPQLLAQGGRFTPRTALLPLMRFMGDRRRGS